MEINLHQQEILSSNVAGPGCMRVLPPGKNKTQKVVVGDVSGTVHCFSVKKMALDTSFKSLPTNAPVTNISLGLGEEQDTKIFVAEGRQVRGVTKKGKEFFRIRFPKMDEDVVSARVHDTFVHVCGKQSVQLVNNGNDVHPPKLSLTRISAFDVAPVAGKGQPYWPMLGCADGKIQVLKDGDVYYSAQVEGAVTALVHNREGIETLPGNKHAGRQEVVYGTQTGVVAQMFLDEQAARRGWVIAGKGLKPAPVTQIHTQADLTRDGMKEVVIAREGGDLEVYARDDMGQMERIAKHAMGESAGSVDSGCITGGSTSDELCVHTVRGRVLVVGTESVVDVAHSKKFRDAGRKGMNALKGLSMVKKLMSTKSMKPGDESGDAKEGEDEEDADTTDINEQENRIKALSMEVAGLEQRVQHATAVLAVLKSTPGVVVSSVSYSEASLTLDESEGAFNLVVESPDGVAVVVLHCTCQIEIQDPGADDGILSCGKSGGEDMASFATLRCKGNATRAHLRIRAIEGRSGRLQVFVVAGVDNKVTQTFSMPIKPLCLHVPASVEEVDQSRPFSELRMQGNFSILDMHAWIGQAVEGVPRAPSGTAEATLALRSCLVRSFMVCTYKQGICVIRSDNLAALAVIREVLARLATAARQQVRISVSMHPDAAQHLCQMTWPRLEYLRGLETRARIVEALKELQMMDGDVTYLSPEHQQALQRADDIREQLALYPAELRYFKSMVKDLHVAFHRFQGAPVPRAVQQRLALRLEDTSDLTLEELVEMIRAES